MYIDNFYIAIIDRYTLLNYYDKFSQLSQFNNIKSDPFKRKSIKTHRKKRYLKHKKSYVRVFKRKNEHKHRTKRYTK